MENFNVGTIEDLRKDLISGNWFIVGGDPDALEEFHKKVFPDIKVVVTSNDPFKTIFWAKKTTFIKSVFSYHDWTSNLVMIEFVKPIKSAFLSKATYIRDENKIEENINQLLSNLWYRFGTKINLLLRINPLVAVRYHSLAAKSEILPQSLKISATADDGTIITLILDTVLKFNKIQS